jgi:hypothetical protein
VSELSNIRPLAKPVNSELVSMLEELLNDARAGKLRGLGIVTIEYGTCVGHSRYHREENTTMAELVGAVSLLHYRLCQTTWNGE